MWAFLLVGLIINTSGRLPGVIFFCISDTLVPTTYLVDTTLSDASDYDQTVHAVRLPAFRRLTAKDKDHKKIKDDFVDNIKRGIPQPWWVFIRCPESGKNAPLRNKFSEHIENSKNHYSVEKIITDSFDDIVERANNANKEEHGEKKIVNGFWIPQRK